LHGTVYSKLEAANRKEKQEKMKLWEDWDVFYKRKI
jgi:ribosomal RNA assembly protein